MGSGTDAAIEASDLTLVRADLGAAADAIRLSRATLRTIKGNLFWAFAYNVAALPLAGRPAQPDARRCGHGRIVGVRRHELPFDCDGSGDRRRLPRGVAGPAWPPTSPASMRDRGRCATSSRARDGEATGPGRRRCRRAGSPAASGARGEADPVAESSLEVDGPLRRRGELVAGRRVESRSTTTTRARVAATDQLPRTESSNWMTTPGEVSAAGASSSTSSW